MRLGSVATKTGNNWEDLSVNLIACYCSERENVLAPGRPIACGSCDKVDRKGNRGPGLIAFKLTPPACPRTWPVTSLFLPIRPEWMTPVFISTITPHCYSLVSQRDKPTIAVHQVCGAHAGYVLREISNARLWLFHMQDPRAITNPVLWCVLWLHLQNTATPLSPQVTWMQRRLTTCPTIVPRAVLYVASAH